MYHKRGISRICIGDSQKFLRDFVGFVNVTCVPSSFKFEHKQEFLSLYENPAMNEDWHTGLYACTHHGYYECIDVTCCCLCELSRQYDASNGHSYSYNLPVLAAGPALFVCLFFILRRRVIDKYHIDEDPILSACTVLFCGSCSTCQVHRELELRSVPCGLTTPCQPRDTAIYLGMR